MTVVSVHAFSDIGLVRARNEDAVLVGGWLCQPHTGVLTTLQQSVTTPLICAVADGMGGHAGGNLASNMALSMLAGVSENCSTVAGLADALRYVNDQIRSVGDDPELKGLGTTVAGLCIATDKILVFNVGDSRVYSVDDGFLQQISVDDSVHDAQGRTTNLVTQSLGQPTAVEPHIIEIPLCSGSFLVCSDGVSAVMPAADLRSAVLNADVRICADALIDGTRDNGAADNFSFLLIEVSGTPVVDDTSSVEAPISPL